MGISKVYLADLNNICRIVWHMVNTANAHDFLTFLVPEVGSVKHSEQDGELQAWGTEAASQLFH